MNRTKEFYGYLLNQENIQSSNRVLRQTLSNPFNEASGSIRVSIEKIQNTLDSNYNSFVDEYNSILAQSSSMNDEERSIFANDLQSSINQVEQQISELADSVKSGKMKLHGQSLDHCLGVFEALDGALNEVRVNFQKMLAQRESVILMRKSVVATHEYDAQKIVDQAKMIYDEKPKEPAISQEFARILGQEHEVIVDELLDLNTRLNATDAQIANISVMLNTFNELIARQTNTIRIVKQNVEEAQQNYEESKTHIDRTAEKTKFSHLWISIIIIIIGLRLILK